MTNRRSPRYRVTADPTWPNRVELTVLEDGPLGDAGRVRRFWCPEDGGYLREVTDRHPGTLGGQVCEHLASTGSTIYCAAVAVARIVRREARSLLAWHEREWAT